MSYYLLFDNRNRHSKNVVAIIKLNDIGDFYSHRVFSDKVKFDYVSDIDEEGYILSKSLKKLVNNIESDEGDDDGRFMYV